MAHATAIHVKGAKGDFHKLDEEIAKGPMPPDGLLMHLVRPTQEGFELLDVWRQARDANTFLTERVEPALQNLGLPFSRQADSEVWSMARP